MKNTDLQVKILLRKCYSALLKILVLENWYKIVVPLFGAAPNKDTTILLWFRSQKTVLNPPVDGKIQLLFKANLIFKDFSSQSCIFKYFSSLCEPCEILHAVSLYTILSRQQIIKALIRLHRCAGWSAPFLLACNKISFFRRGQYLGYTPCKHFRNLCWDHILQNSFMITYLFSYCLSLLLAYKKIIPYDLVNIKFAFVCLIDLILYVTVNNFSVMSGWVFLGWTSTKQG